jgi:KDO2-lipid IV(A) lauroyltransferase
MKKELLNVFKGNIAITDIRKILKKSFTMISKEKIEVLLFSRLNQEMIRRICLYDGLEMLDKALKENKGVILLTAHFGHNRFIMPALGFLGYKINQIGAPPTVWKELEKMVSPMKARALELELESERSLPARFIYYDKFMREAFQCLNRNEVLVIAADSVGKGKKIAVDFLCRTAHLSPGPFNLARKTGAPILPVFVIRNHDNTQTIKFEKSMCLSNSKDIQKDNESYLRRFVQLLEYYIMKYPCHYLKHLYWVQLRRDLDPIPFFRDSVNRSYLVNQKQKEMIP